MTGKWHFGIPVDKDYHVFPGNEEGLTAGIGRLQDASLVLVGTFGRGGQYRCKHDPDDVFGHNSSFSDIVPCLLFPIHPLACLVSLR